VVEGDNSELRITAPAMVGITTMQIRNSLRGNPTAKGGSVLSAESKDEGRESRA
jgi:hypothetical protein